MGSRTRKERQIQIAIGEILLHRWHPIGIREVPEAADEYDGYVGPVYRLLAAGASDAEIAQHLVQIETETMGLSRGDWHMLTPLAQELQQVFRQLSSEPAAT